MLNYVKKIVDFITENQLWPLVLLIVSIPTMLYGVVCMNGYCMLYGFVFCGGALVELQYQDYYYDEPEETYKGHFERD